MLLEQLHEEVLRCAKCPLSQGRANAVPGEGSLSAKVMFVGEGPGAEEDRLGRPFVGPAGKLLDELLLHAGLPRPAVFITNIVKCRPPGNREPQPLEVAACRPYLVSQIALIRPAVICPLGSPALRTLLGKDIQISHVHGHAFKHRGMVYMPLYHPAAALHKGNLRQTLFDDMLALRRTLEELSVRVA